MLAEREESASNKENETQQADHIIIKTKDMPSSDEGENSDEEQKEQEPEQEKETEKEEPRPESPPLPESLLLRQAEELEKQVDEMMNRNMGDFMSPSKVQE